MKTRNLFLVMAALVVAVSCGQRGASKNEKADDAVQIELSEEEQDAVNAAAAMEEKYAPKIEAGTLVDDFTVKTSTGEDFTFSSLKGNYVVLDFWASWCPDCREEIPAVKKLFEEFSPKGVKFVSFSVDNDEEAWKGALAEENMEWLQVSNLIKWHENPVANFFGMGWIPTMFLIDPDGKIVGFALTAVSMKALLLKTL